jgi:acyl carrier protein
VEPELGMDGLLDLIAREAEMNRSELDLNRPLDELGIASLQMINIVFAIEDRYKVTISPEEMQSAATLGELVTLARARMRNDTPL